MVRTRKPEAPTSDLQAVLEPGADVDSLRRGLEILRLFDARHRSLQVSEIATKLGLSRVTATKLVATLEAHNFLRPSGQADGYEPHVACLTLGRSVRRGLQVAQVAQPKMRALSARFDVHVSLTTRDRLHMLVVEHCVPRGKVSLGLSTGTRLPITTSASGRAYLWAQQPALRGKLMESLEEAEKGDSFKLMSSVYGALQELAERGWCFVTSTVTSQASSIATPIWVGEESNFVLAVMAIGDGEMEQHLCEVIAPELLVVASQIAQELQQES